MHCGHAVLLFFMGMFQQVPIAAIGPLLPYEMNRRQLSQIFTGLALCLYGVTWIFVPELTVKYIFPRLGRVVTGQMGTIVTGFGLLFMAIGGSFSNFYIFSIFTFLGRLVQGLGTAFEQTSYTAVIGHSFQEHRSKYMAVYSFSLTVGLISGPLVSGFLDPATSYALVFFILAMISFLRLLGYYAYKERDRPRYLVQRRLGMRSTCKICRKLPPLFAFIAAYVVSSTYLNFEPVLANSLKDNYYYSQSKMGLYFATFIASSVAVSFPLTFLPQGMDKRGFILASIFCSSVFSFIVGPSQMFKMPHNPVLTLIGIIGTGASYGLGFNFLFPEAFRACSTTFTVEQYLLVDKVSSLIPTIWGLQKLLIPLYISGLDQLIGFALTFDLIGIIHFLIFLVHLLVTIIDRHRGEGHEPDELEDDDELDKFIKIPRKLNRI